MVGIKRFNYSRIVVAGVVDPHRDFVGIQVVLRIRLAQFFMSDTFPHTLSFIVAPPVDPQESVAIRGRWAKAIFGGLGWRRSQGPPRAFVVFETRAVDLRETAVGASEGSAERRSAGERSEP